MRSRTTRALGGLAALMLALVVTPAAADDVVVADNPHPPAAATGVEPGWRISPDGRWAVHRADLVDDGVVAFRLYASFLDGGPVEPIPLSEPAVAGGNVTSFSITPDSSHVVFVGDLRTDERFELFARSIDGLGDQVVLSDVEDADGDVADHVVSQDSRWVAYRGDTRTADRVEVFAVPLDGSSPPAVLNGPGLPDSDVTVTYRVTNDSSAVVFRADLDVDGRHELYRRAIDGSGPQVRLNDTPTPGGEVSLNFHVTDTDVVYTGDLVVDEQAELFSRALDGSGTQRRLSDHAANPSGDVNDRVVVSPDGTRALFHGDLVDDGVFELWSALVDGSGAQTNVSGPSQPLGDVALATYDITPDGTRATFVGDLQFDGVEPLWSAPLDGSGPRVRLSESQAASVDLVFMPVVSPAGDVFFRADLDDDGVLDLWTTPAAGGGPLAEVSQAQGHDGDVFEFFPSADGSRVVYVGQLTTDGDVDLYSRPVPVTNARPQVRLGDLQIVVFGSNAVVSPDGRHVTRRLTTSDDLVATTDGQVPTTPRIAGSDRYATAAATSAQAFSPRAPVAYVATGQAFPDALSAGPAAARDRGPVLLTRPDALPAVTADELARLRPRAIVVLGGTSAVGAGVAIALEALTDAPVTRLSGPDRFATSVAISEGFPAGVDVAYVTTGRAFPDALAGGPLARDDGPILLTEPDALPQVVADELTRLAPDRIVVLGGEAAVSASVEAALAPFTPNPVERLAGADRFATAAAISGEFPARVDTLYVATGRAFPDALAASSAAVRDRAPLLLVEPDAVPPVVQAEAVRLAPRRIVVLGGTAAVDDAVVTALLPALRAPEDP